MNRPGGLFAHAWIFTARLALRQKRKQYSPNAKDIVSKSMGSADVATLWQRYESDARWQFIQPLRVSANDHHYNQQDFDKANQVIAEITEHSQARVRDIRSGSGATHQSPLRSQQQTDRRRPPLSGRFEQYGKQSLAAIEMAFKSRPDIELVVKHRWVAAVASQIVKASSSNPRHKSRSLAQQRP